LCLISTPLPNYNLVEVSTSLPNNPNPCPTTNPTPTNAKEVLIWQMLKFGTTLAFIYPNHSHTRHVKETGVYLRLEVLQYICFGTCGPDLFSLNTSESPLRTVVNCCRVQGANWEKKETPAWYHEDHFQSPNILRTYQDL